MFLGRYKTLWLDASDPDATGDDETLTKLKVSFYLLMLERCNAPFPLSLC